MDFCDNPLNSQSLKYSTNRNTHLPSTLEACSYLQGSADQGRGDFPVWSKTFIFSLISIIFSRGLLFTNAEYSSLVVNLLPGKPGSLEKAFVSPGESMHPLNWANPGHYCHDQGINLNGRGCTNQQIPECRVMFNT